MQLLTPDSLTAAVEMMSASSAPVTPIAGGTDLMVSWLAKSTDDLVLMDLSRIAGLDGVRFSDEWLELGAMTTYWQVIELEAVRAEFPLLAEAASQVGAVQIQTRGTWAGNIGNGSPAADGVPVLMAYDAIVQLRSVDGIVETPLDQYFTGYKQSVRTPGQLITGIRIPRRRRDVHWFEKVGSRSAQAITKVGVAVVHDDRGWRVVANSVAPFVCRCRNMEKALDEGLTFKSPADILAVLAQDISPIDDIRSTAEYRACVLSRLLFYRLADHGKS